MAASSSGVIASRCAMAACRLRIPDADALLSQPQIAGSWEGMVVEEILRQLGALGVAHDYAYYRTGAGAEVDLVLTGQFGLVAVEIKQTSIVNERDLRALRDFVTSHKARLGVVVTTTPWPGSTRKTCWGCPSPGCTRHAAGRGPSTPHPTVIGFPFCFAPSPSRNGAAVRAHSSGPGYDEAEPPKQLRSMSVSMIPGFSGTAAMPDGSSWASAWVRPSIAHLVAQ